jgi:hypothetical protein
MKKIPSIILSPSILSSVPAEMTDLDEVTDYVDTFVDETHLRQSFEGCEVSVRNISASESQRYRLCIQRGNKDAGTLDKVSAFSYDLPSTIPRSTIRLLPISVI